MTCHRGRWCTNSFVAGAKRRSKPRERLSSWPRLIKARQAKRGFVLMPQVLATLHFVVFVMLMSPKVAVLLNSTVSS